MLSGLEKRAKIITKQVMTTHSDPRIVESMRRIHAHSFALKGTCHRDFKMCTELVELTWFSQDVYSSQGYHSAKCDSMAPVQVPLTMCHMYKCQPPLGQVDT